MAHGLIEGKIGSAAEAALKMLHEVDGAIIKIVLRDKDDCPYAAIILVEGDDTGDVVTLLNDWEEKE